MVDIHAHILAGVDHGAAKIGESLEMLKAFESVGVKRVFCTSHFYTYSDDLGAFTKKYDEAFNELTQLNETGIKLERGAEVSVSRYFHYNAPAKELLLGNTGKILIELPFSSELPKWVFDCVSALKNDYGLVPIVAHIEVYPAIHENPELALELKSAGARLHIDAESLKNPKTKKLTGLFLKSGIINYVASDSHYSTYRDCLLSDARATLNKRIGKEKADVLFNNAERLR